MLGSFILRLMQYIATVRQRSSRARSHNGLFQLFSKAIWLIWFLFHIYESLFYIFKLKVNFLNSLRHYPETSHASSYRMARVTGVGSQKPKLCTTRSALNFCRWQRLKEKRWKNSKIKTKSCGNKLVQFGDKQS